MVNSRIPLAKVSLVLAILITGFLYWRGASQQLTLVNTRMQSTDQSAYMNYARQMVETGYTFIGGRNRMPLYPFLQSLFYDPDLTDQQFFLQGKYVNLLLSLGLLAGIGLILSRFFHGLHFINLMLILTFMVFIFKAGFFQAELLFYFLNFCLFLLLWRMLTDPSWVIAVLTGLVAALAHLTKASILPGLLIFIASLGLDWLITLARQERVNRRSPFVRPSSFRKPVYAAVVLLCFLAVIFPYIRTSKEVFGHYFYNVNSTFYMWYDSWEEAKAGTAAHGDREGWPAMPAHEIPSLSKYLREHSADQIIKRFLDGGILITRKAANSYGYFKYVVIYAVLLVVAAAGDKSRTIRIIRSNIALSVFVLFYFAAYFLLYAWYSPMVDGNNRLILAQFLPLMFAMSVGLQHEFKGRQISLFSYKVNALTLFNAAILAIIIFDIWVVLTRRIDTMYGGF